MGIALKDPRLALAMALAIGSVTAAPRATVAAPMLAMLSNGIRKKRC
ncbi:hypothetical protein LGM42_22735 [Burkholderia sp. AU39826]|nr:hypothetical protein [Burkholderia sp. AU39826]MCA7972695.1 hypothetical protein [Burkholderia sp. AU39826]